MAAERSYHDQVQQNQQEALESVKDKCHNAEVDVEYDRINYARTSEKQSQEIAGLKAEMARIQQKAQVKIAAQYPEYIDPPPEPHHESLQRTIPKQLMDRDARASAALVEPLQNNHQPISSMQSITVLSPVAPIPKNLNLPRDRGFPGSGIPLKLCDKYHAPWTQVPPLAPPPAKVAETYDLSYDDNYEEEWEEEEEYSFLKDDGDQYKQGHAAQQAAVTNSAIQYPSTATAASAPQPVQVTPFQYSNKKEADKISFEAITDAPRHRMWKLKSRKSVAGASIHPQKAFMWWGEIERAQTFEELEDSGEFETLDAKAADSLSKLVHGDLARQLLIMETELFEKYEKMLKGRQIAWLINKHFKMSETEGAILEFEDILNVDLKNGNLKQFLHDLDMALLAMNELPSANQLESLFRRQLKKCEELRQELSWYDMEIAQGRTTKSYERLKSIVRAYLEETQNEES